MRIRRVIVSVVIATGLLIGLALPSYATDWLSGWDNRVAITIDNGDIDATLTDFPILIYLSGSSGINSEDITFVFDEVGANDKKIALTEADGTTELYVEVEDWDSVGEDAWLWAKVPSVNSTADTTVYLYYDNTHADNDTYIGDTNSATAENVWDANFVAVWHLAEASGNVLDSTTNDNDGTNNGATTGATGIVDGAYDFETDDSDYADMGSGAILDDIAIKTVEAQINLESWGQGTSGRIIQKANVNADGWQLLVQSPAGEDRLYFGQDWNNGNFAQWVTPNNSLSLSTDYHVAITYDLSAVGNDPLMYVDGASLAVTELAAPPGGSADSDAINNLWLGARYNSGSPDREHDGIIDEARVSNIARPAAWLKATYESNRDHLLDFGTATAFGAPTGFTVTEEDGNVVYATWTDTAGADNTEIRVQHSSYPTSITDGDQAYYGNAASANLTGYSLDTTTYYFRAWAWSGATSSTDYAEDNIGGESMILLALLAFAGVLSGLTLWNGSLLVAIASSGAWLAFMAYIRANPPGAMVAGDAAHTMLIVALIGVALAMPFIAIMRGRRREIGIEEQDERRGLIRKWAKSPSPEAMLLQRKEGQRAETPDEYRVRVHQALHRKRSK